MKKMVEQINSKDRDQLIKFGKTYYVFISYSHLDRKDVKENIKKPIEELNLTTCTHEDDFVLGEFKIDNIVSAICKSLKVILVISKNFTENYLFKYVTYHAVSLSLDMRNAIIPLILDDSELPDSLSICHSSCIYMKNDGWFKNLETVLKSPIEEKHEQKKPPELQGEKEFHFMSIAHPGTLKEENQNYAKLQILRQIKEDESRQFEFVDIRLGSVDNHNFELWKDGSKNNAMALFEIISTILNYSRRAYKILIWLSDEFENNYLCKNVTLMLCMLATDLGKDSPCIIPIQLEDGEIRGGPEIQDDMFTHLFTENEKWRDRLISTICTKNHPRRHDKQECIFKEGTNICRVARFSGKEENDEEYPRYLGVSFAGDDLVLLDADNKVIKKCNIFGTISDRRVTANDMEEFSKEKSASLMPNRLSKIDEKNFVVLCRNDNKVFAINSSEMNITNVICTNPAVCLKGITISQKGIYATTGEHPPKIIFIDASKKGDNVEEKLTKVDNECFGLPRRLTETPDGTRVVVADEDDRRLVVLNPEENGNLTVEYSTKRWQRNLSNVRGLAASNSVVYVAACNCINTFSLEKKEMDRNNLIKFTEVLHTRAVSLHSSGNFLAISQMCEDTDMITVFCLNCDQ